MVGCSNTGQDVVDGMAICMAGLQIRRQGMHRISLLGLILNAEAWRAGIPFQPPGLEVNGSAREQGHHGFQPWPHESTYTRTASVMEAS